ncbi:adenylosuccinate lyase [Candidatus Peregrinibacteria bacterium RIFCSPLOWO2_02_FULL_48_14]|nr:MAG: adenylosuccinate lyase [Candidatus Peregrinibacteria bacterium RIFCSPLOWO2_01_FULL_48_20]OGJ44608.1 MAG: adenylosuccinate lyase [Candidatus Peregrinibacteria bacterium RIFCSPLOWO2_02_FULL_48_14]
MNKALSPLDGRYVEKVGELARFFSESALIRSRIAVEVEWLIFLTNTLKLKGTERLNPAEAEALRKLYTDFRDEFADEVKEIEKTTNHDVKAVEYFLQKALEVLKRGDLISFVHFGCTSEDINNLAYAQMLKGGVQTVLMVNLEKVLAYLKEMAETYRKIPMMSRTHGQAASPTTVGKEFKNVGARLFRQYEQLSKAQYLGKLNGATGNFNAHAVAYPEVDWIAASRQFVEGLGLEWQRYTTQIEPHDYMAEIFDNLRRTNTILIDFCRDIWTYISLGYFTQRVVKGEVGSSTMPHKVNPIDFENAEGNLGLANALFTHFSEKLPVSRMQRDLTDSTVLRNIGTALGYSLLAYKSLQKGLSKLEVNEKKLQEDLDENWELLGEAIQTVMRRYGIQNAYEQLKELTRGSKMTQEKIAEFVETLDIPGDAKKRLLKLSPAEYIGLASQL